MECAGWVIWVLLPALRLVEIVVGLFLGLGVLVPFFGLTIGANGLAIEVAPGRPTAFNATAVSTTGIELEWTLADAYATGVRVERSTNGGASYSTLTTLAAGATSHTDTGLDSATTYHYRVVALGVEANSFPSASDSATTESDEIFPLELSANGRHFVDQAGDPFLINGDAAYGLIAQLSGSNLDTYLDTMQGLSVNCILVSLFEAYFSDNPPDNALGESPFAGAEDDFTDLNPDYFDHARTVIDEAKARNMVVFLEACYLGFNGGEEGFFNAFDAMSVGERETFAEAIAAEIGDRTNVVWIIGGDYTPASLTKVNAFAAALKAAVSVPCLFSYHTGPNSSSNAAGLGAWEDFNNVYIFDTTGAPSDEFIDAYELSGPILGLNFEPRYEGFASSVKWIREQAWGAVLAGLAGTIGGVEARWHFDAPTGFITTGWVASLASEWTLDLPHIVTALSDKQWYGLIPDTSDTLVTAGRGTEGNDGYVLAGITADDTFACIYCPDNGQITVDMSEFADTVTARWFNPRDGGYTAIDDYANSGTQNFTPPSNTDWVLMLEVL